MQGNLEAHFSAYIEDPFEYENRLTIGSMASKCVLYSVSKSTYLELGLGHGVALKILSENFKSITALDGSLKMIERFANIYDNVQLEHTYFEDYQTEKKYDSIGMGFVLEHVEDPLLILKKYRDFLREGGSIFIGVPNAASLHRLLALEAGLIDDIRALSAQDIAFGHRRFFSNEDWHALFSEAGYTVERNEGLYLKPFTTKQIQSLNLNERVYSALGKLAMPYPSISNACFFELKA